MTSTTNALVKAAPTSTTCTHRNDVPALFHASPVQARSSRTTARMNLGQMTMLNTAANTSSHDCVFEITHPIPPHRRRIQ